MEIDLLEKIRHSSVIDVHMLYGEDFWLKNNKPQLIHKNDKLSDDEVSFILPFPSSKNNLYIAENELVAKASLKSNNIIPVFAFNPQLKQNVECVKKLSENLEFFGIIIWPILCGIDLKKVIDNAEFKDFLDSQSDKRHFFVEIHTGAGNEKNIGRVSEMGNYLPMDVVNVAKAFPKIKFILTHSLRLSLPALDEAKKLENVVISTEGISSQKRWFENSQNVFPAYDAEYLGNLDSREIIRCLYNDLGYCDKLVFGSSYPYSMWWGFDVDSEINLIKNCGLSSDAIHKILKNNILNFLRLN